MLQQPISAMFIRMIPEAFLFIYSIYRLTNSKLNIKRILISSILGGIGVYISRLLPIHFGVHTILNIMLYIVLAVKINHIDIYKAIATALVLQIILFVCDFILLVVYTDILLYPSEILFGQTWVAAVAGFPPLILFYLLVLLTVYFRGKRVNDES